MTPRDRNLIMIAVAVIVVIAIIIYSMKDRRPNEMGGIYQIQHNELNIIPYNNLEKT